MRRREKEPEEENQIIEEVWDKKRVALGFFLLLLLAIGAVAAMFFIFPSDSHIAADSRQRPSRVLGATADGEKESRVLKIQSLPQTLKEKLEQIKEQIVHLDPSEIASSSPQVQKVLKDIQSLKEYPHNQARELCENMCKSL